MLSLSRSTEAFHLCVGVRCLCATSRTARRTGPAGGCCLLRSSRSTPPSAPSSACPSPPSVGLSPDGLPHTDTHGPALAPALPPRLLTSRGWLFGSGYFIWGGTQTFAYVNRTGLKCIYVVWSLDPERFDERNWQAEHFKTLLTNVCIHDILYLFDSGLNATGHFLPTSRPFVFPAEGASSLHWAEMSPIWCLSHGNWRHEKQLHEQIARCCLVMCSN